MKTVGVIGGLGPSTTAKFYIRLTTRDQSSMHQRLPSVLIDNVTISKKVEEDILLHGIRFDQARPLLVESAKRLEQGGANFFVMPCNTLHVHEEALRQSVRIPFISIIAETIVHLQQEHVNDIFVLASAATIKTKLIEARLTANSIRCHTPSEDVQRSLNHLIHEIVTTGTFQENEVLIQQIKAEAMKAKVSHILLACTDLQHAFPTIPGYTMVDTFQILLSAVQRELQTSTERNLCL